MGPLSRKVSCVVGHTGYGKSLWTSAAVADEPRLLVATPFAYKNEFDTQRIVGMRALLDFFLKAPETFRVAYTCDFCTRPCCKGKRTEFAHLCELVWAVKRMTFVVSEVAASRHMPRNTPAPLPFIDLATQGRHREVSMVLEAQRPYYLPIEIRSESDELVAFNLTEPRDRDWVGDYPGARDYVENLESLERLHYMRFTKEPREVVRGRVEVPCS